MAMTAEHQRYAACTELSGLRNLVACVGKRDAGAAADEQFRGGDAAPGRADDHHPLPIDRERPGHRSFRVVRLHSAQTIAMITNRAMTFGSLQPISSK